MNAESGKAPNGPLRVLRVRRTYNRWVANETLEDYALRFTAKEARRWSSFRVANTALGATSFLALEAIGGAITLTYGQANAVTAILVVCAIIFAFGLPVSAYAARYGVDIDLMTRGAGFGFLGSTITSLIYASFTYLFFAIEAAIMALALELCLGVPLWLGYVLSSIVVIPLVTHGISLISRFQLWTQPLWIALQLLPIAFIATRHAEAFDAWTGYTGTFGRSDGALDLLAVAAASTVVFSLVAQIGEQVDFLRFMPPRRVTGRLAWWSAVIAAGPGWIIPGCLKLLLGSFLAVFALSLGVPAEHAGEPTQMYLAAFGALGGSPGVTLALMGVFVVVAQLKINVTNAYAGSIAWSNFFSRLTHSHPGRVVWLVFNVAIALLLMELGIFRALENILGLYAIVAIAWMAAVVADLVVNKPLGLSPRGVEFRRAYLYDINPVGVGAVLLGAGGGSAAYAGLFGATAQALACFIALGLAFAATPLLAWATGGRRYIARTPDRASPSASKLACVVCEHDYEREDMARCPAYGGAICSLCCSLDARCDDLCKPEARLGDQFALLLRRALPGWLVSPAARRLGTYLAVFTLFAVITGGILAVVYIQATMQQGIDGDAIRRTFWTLYVVLLIIIGVAAWLFVLAQESRSVAQEESRLQTQLLTQEIEAHRVTDAQLVRAKNAAEAANLAKTRFVVGVNHELRTPLNAILGYAQLLERDPDMPPRRRDAIGVVRRSAEHLRGLIDGLLDIAKIEAGRLELVRDQVRIGDLLSQTVDMFRLQAAAKGIDFVYEPSPRLPGIVHTDEKRLRQILINLLSNAIKFTPSGQVALRVRYGGEVAEIEVADTGIGIAPADLDRIFRPFERVHAPGTAGVAGIGLGLTITKLFAEILGGEITVASTPGIGSRFRVRLMLPEVADPRASEPVEAPIRGYLGPRRRILVADDDADHRNLVADLLVPLGFEVLAALDGPSCVVMVRDLEPDLVLLDISMPGLDGWEVARRLRVGGGRTPRIVIVSANAAIGLTPRIEVDLHDAVLPKPVDLRLLLGTMRDLLGIEWIVGASEPPPLWTPAVRPVISLPPSVIEELIALGRIGHVRGIEARLDAVEDAARPHDPGLGQLRDMVRRFDLPGFVATLETLPR